MKPPPAFPSLSPCMLPTGSSLLFFFFNDTAPTEIYTLSLHDALPICRLQLALDGRAQPAEFVGRGHDEVADRKSTRLNSSHQISSYAVFCWKKKKGSRAGRGEFAIDDEPEQNRDGVSGAGRDGRHCDDGAGSGEGESDEFLFLISRRPPVSTRVPYTTRFR